MNVLNELKSLEEYFLDIDMIGHDIYIIIEF